MPNKVEAGMRFRRRDDGKTFTAVSEWGKGRSSINGQPDWYVEEDDSHRSLSSDDLYEPIPEPAPELCAYKDCREAPTDAVHRCVGSCPTPCPRNTLGCHPFVAPQAKPVSAKPTDIYAGPPITGTAKPVLREPKARADGYPDVCLKCRGDKGGLAYVCWPCSQPMQSNDFYAIQDAWKALHRKPAAKDIPSLAADTEAARGGEAATFIGIDWGAALACEQGPSAVAAAPGVEPWRPTVDDDFWIPNASEGWRR